MAKSLSFQELALLLGALSCSGAVACARAAEPPRAAGAAASMRADGAGAPAHEAQAPVAAMHEPGSAAMHEPEAAAEHEALGLAATPSPAHEPLVPETKATAPVGTAQESAGTSETAGSAVSTDDARSADSSTTTSTSHPANAEAARGSARPVTTAPRSKSTSGKKKVRRRGQGGCGAGTCA